MVFVGNHFDSNFLFTIPQKLSNKTVSVPCAQRTKTLTSFSSGFCPRTSRICRRTPNTTWVGITFNLAAPSSPVSFIFRRAKRDHTFSAANPVPEERA